MRLRFIHVTIGSVFALAFVFVFGVSSAQAIFNACACSCIDSEDTGESYIRSTGSGSCQEEYDAIQPPLCVDPAVLLNAYKRNFPSLITNPDDPSTGDRCVFECSNLDARLEWISLSPNRTDCRGDCTEACLGAANLDPTQNQNQNLFQVPCLRDDHCSIGQFSVYEDVRCQYTRLYESDDATAYNYWPDHIRPQCVIPPTLQNADKECREYGGQAKGGLCIRIPSGTSPAGYFITRPYVNTSGVYTVENFDETDLGALNTLLDNSPTDEMGLCALYGLAEGVEYDIADVIPIGIKIGVGAETGPIGEVTGSSRFICAKRRSNTCGSITPTGPLSTRVRSASQFRCLVPELLGIDESYCFTRSESETLCVNDPGTRCCAQMAAGCEDDLDCVPPRQCLDIDPSSGFGDCGFNPICDPQNDDRRCRSASDPEKANDSICSPPLHTMASFGTRCINPNQACCNDGTPEAIGTCASDMAMDNPAGGPWGNYRCIDPSEIPASQYRQTVSGAVELIPWDSTDPKGYCLDRVPAGGRVGASLERCDRGEICCSLTNMQLSTHNTYLLGNPPGQNGRYTYGNGFGCPGYITERGEVRADQGFGDYVCTSPGDAIQDDFAQSRGYLNAQSYLGALARSSYCQVTPLSAGHYMNNEECAPDYLCCNQGINLEALCNNDEHCSVDEIGTPGMRCDLEINLCVPGEALEESQQLAGDLCFNKAVEAGDRSGVDWLDPDSEDGFTEESFTCQIVEDKREVLSYNCLQLGCDDIEGEIPEGHVLKCCLPGMGMAPTAAAEAAAEPERAADIQRGKYTIGLPACIGSGQCGLDDIIATGANFANLLIGLSGSVFLAIFVYAGFLYLTAGTSERVGKAKKMLVQASIAMVLILGAFVFVRFIQQSLIAAATGEEKAECGNTEDTKGSTCVLLPVDASDEKALSEMVKEKGCVRGKCPGAKNFVCCPLAPEE